MGCDCVAEKRQWAEPFRVKPTDYEIPPAHLPVQKPTDRLEYLAPHQDCLKSMVLDVVKLCQFNKLVFLLCVIIF